MFYSGIYKMSVPAEKWNFVSFPLALTSGRISTHSPSFISAIVGTCWERESIRSLNLFAISWFRPTSTKDFYMRNEYLFCFTGGFELSSCGFSKIWYRLERNPMDYIELICSLKSELSFIFICSIRIHSRKQDIVENQRSLILSSM